MYSFNYSHVQVHAHMCVQACIHACTHARTHTHTHTHTHTGKVNLASLECIQIFCTITYNETFISVKEKAAVLVELEQLKQVRDELTLEVANLTTELEKERSVVHALKAADTNKSKVRYSVILRGYAAKKAYLKIGESLTLTW